MANKEINGTSSLCEDEQKAFESLGVHGTLNKKLDLFSIGVLNSLSAHIAVLDKDGVIIAVNKAWEQFAEQNSSNGVSVSVGSNYFNVCLKAINEEDDNDALNALKGIQKVLSSEMDEFEYEYACHSPDEKRWFLMRVTPMSFIGNKAVVSHIKITDKKTAEMSLIEREKELSALNFIGRKVSSSISLEDVVNEALEQIAAIVKPDLAMIFIKEGEDLMLKGMGPKNNAYKYKISDKHRVGQCLCGLSVSDEISIFSNNLQNDSRCTWKECKVAGFTSFAAIPFKCREEVIGTLGMGSISKRNFEKRQQFLEAIVNDVSICLENSLLYEKVKTYAEDLKAQLSDRKKIEKALVQTQKMEAIGNLAGGIAHDFNNILSAIIGYTELASMAIPQNSQISDYLNSIMQAGNRARNLVQQILTYSRQSEREHKPLLMKLVTKEAIKLLRASLPSTIEIRQNLNSDALVMGDPTQIHQILMNLCTNAGHAMKESGGILEVNLLDVDIDSTYISRHPGLKPGPYIKLTVSDTGCGIPENVIDRVFDPFFTTKKREGGTGMGLAVVQGIVESCQGTIHVESEPEIGTRFKVFLPTIESAMTDDDETAETIPEGVEKILFIDDEPTLIDIGKRMLENLGYQVTAVKNPEEALILFREQVNTFDLVVTDMTMPEMTGDKLARKLIAIRKDIPVVLCTGFSSGVTEEKAKKMGIRGFLMKPIILSDIAKLVRKLLDEAKDKAQL